MTRFIGILMLCTLLWPLVGCETPQSIRARQNQFMAKDAAFRKLHGLPPIETTGYLTDADLQVWAARAKASREKEAAKRLLASQVKEAAKEFLREPFSGTACLGRINVAMHLPLVDENQDGYTARGTLRFNFSPGSQPVEQSVTGVYGRQSGFLVITGESGFLVIAGEVKPREIHRLILARDESVWRGSISGPGLEPSCDEVVLKTTHPPLSVPPPTASTIYAMWGAMPYRGGTESEWRYWFGRSQAFPPPATETQEAEVADFYAAGGKFSNANYEMALRLRTSQFQKSGRVELSEKIADHYSQGLGVQRDDKEADRWRGVRRRVAELASKTCHSPQFRKMMRAQWGAAFNGVGWRTIEFKDRFVCVAIFQDAGIEPSTEDQYGRELSESAQFDELVLTGLANMFHTKPYTREFTGYISETGRVRVSGKGLPAEGVWFDP